MLHLRVSRLIALGVVVLLFASACASTVPSDVATIEVFGPYRADEAAKFAATVAAFEEETGIDVRYVGTGSFAKDLQTRVNEANYPDVAIFPQPALLSDMARKGLLTPVPDDVAARFVASVPGAIIGDSVGTLYGVWFRAAAKSLVWYRPDVFDAAGYVVPDTWDALIALGDQMKEDGVAPWCLGMESFSATGWVGTDWVEDIVLRQQGVTLFDDWVTGEVAFASSEIANAFTTFGSIVHDKGSVLGGTNSILNVSWQDAADPMFETTPRCMMQKQASFWISNVPPDITFGSDLDFFVLPGITKAAPPVLVSGDLAAAFNDRPDVAAFMEFLTTPEAGEGWASLGGFTSPHSNFDPTAYTFEVDQRVGEVIAEAPNLRFDGSDLMPSVVGTDAFWAGIREFVRTGVAPLAEIDAVWPQAELFGDG
jgi:alpha-glucoside transport system substrate-binding protein